MTIEPTPDIILELPGAPGGQISGFSKTKSYLRYGAGPWREWYHLSETEERLVAQIIKLQARLAETEAG